jgi:hypothetical protein
VAAAKWPLVIEQGATFQLGLTLSTGGLVADGGTVIDLTGYQARMQVRKRIASVDTLLFLSTEVADDPDQHIVITDAVNGELVITIPADETAAFTWFSGSYDLEIESAGGFVRRLLYGSVKVTKEVTR